MEFGKDSPRFCVLYAHGPPTCGRLSVQDDVYRDRCVNPATIRGYIRGLDDLLMWAGALKIPIADLREFDVAVFLRDQASRGHSVLVRLYRTIVWIENCFGFDLHSRSPMVKSQSIIQDIAPRPPAVSALMATVKMVSDMENFILTAPTLPLRVYAGGCCCLAHAVLRWAGLLWSQSVHLTADALVAVCWKMQKKRVQTPWAARGL